jgi:hypothetical protein
LRYTRRESERLFSSDDLRTYTLLKHQLRLLTWTRALLLSAAVDPASSRVVDRFALGDALAWTLMVAFPVSPTNFASAA